MKGLTVILAAAGATLAGAAIALLYAPRKGAETRKQLLDYAKAYCPNGICGGEEKKKSSSTNSNGSKSDTTNKSVSTETATSGSSGTTTSTNSSNSSK